MSIMALWGVAKSLVEKCSVPRCKWGCIWIRHVYAGQIWNQGMLLCSGRTTTTTIKQRKVKCSKQKATLNRWASSTFPSSQLHVMGQNLSPLVSKRKTNIRTTVCMAVTQPRRCWAGVSFWKGSAGFIYFLLGVKGCVGFFVDIRFLHETEPGSHPDLPKLEPPNTGTANPRALC